MIRYMVLVYRWGAGWLGAVGDWGGFVGGIVTGGDVTGGTLFRSGVGRRGWSIFIIASYNTAA